MVKQQERRLIWGEKEEAKEKEEKDLEESGAAVPFGLHVVLPDMRGRVRGKGSASINSCYITSLCWCQVAERKARRESAMTLFFSVVRPHLAPLLSTSFHSGFVSMDTDRLCVYPTLQGGPEMLVPLLSSSSSLSPSFILLCYYHSILSLTTVCYFIHNVIPASCLSCPCFLKLLSKHRWRLDTAAQILFPGCVEGPASKHCRDRNVVRHESLGFRFLIHCQ